MDSKEETVRKINALVDDPNWQKANISGLVLAYDEEDHRNIHGNNFARSKKVLHSLSKLKLEPGSTIVERGCGVGTNLIILKHLFPTCSICGYDINRETLRLTELLIEYYHRKSFIDRSGLQLINKRFTLHNYIEYDYVMHSNIDLSCFNFIGKLPPRHLIGSGKVPKIILIFIERDFGKTFSKSYVDKQVELVKRYFSDVEILDDNLVLLRDWHLDLK